MNTIIPVVTVPQIQIHVNSQSQREQWGELSPLVELTHIHVNCTLLQCTVLQCDTAVTNEYQVKQKGWSIPSDGNQLTNSAQ